MCVDVEVEQVKQLGIGYLNSARTVATQLSFHSNAGHKGTYGMETVTPCNRLEK